MNETLEPGGIARRLLLRRVLGAGIVVAIGSRRGGRRRMREVIIDNFTFSPTPLTVKAGTTVTWVNHDDIPHSIVCPALKVQSHPIGYGRQLRLHVRAGGDLRLPLRPASAYAWAGGGAGLNLAASCLPCQRSISEALLRASSQFAAE